MTYEYHSDDQCDRCDKKVGRDSLKPLLFLFKDMNDVAHKDEGDGYRHYRVCGKCWRMEERISKRKNEEKYKLDVLKKFKEVQNGL